MLIGKNNLTWKRTKVAERDSNWQRRRGKNHEERKRRSIHLKASIVHRKSDTQSIILNIYAL